MTSAPSHGISVLAGPNGAGKSSVAGEVLKAAGGSHFNPDDAARRLLLADPSLDAATANSQVWNEMVRLLEEAISGRRSFTFETTLGGNTITRLLVGAAIEGVPVRVWYVALASADLHVDRVRRRVAEGGHDIPEALIRSRYDASRLHLIELIPHLAELAVYDNSAEVDASMAIPEPTLLLHMAGGHVVESCPLMAVPAWAKGIVQAGLNAARER